MRPVRLELNGFAGFRVATVVDFTDADYFALVGSTGSGKSTILDALTFALYGTAYRWGRSNAISYALAPTSNRCTVSLTFDVASQRYQVAREVRRIGGQVQQKAVSLVRFADPTAGAVHPNGPQPEVLAGEIKELNAAVEQLLGLSFDDFCQCVVLPQGDFARFLSANTADRQRILLKLLGAAHYEGIGKRAGVQRDAAAKEVEVLTEQLGRYAGATPEAEAEARARVSALELLATSVDALVPGVDEAHARAAEAAARAQALGGQADLLASISAPHGVEELQRAADDAQRAVEKAREAEAEAGRALADAHAAGRAAPERAAIEHTRDLHLERADLAARRERVFAAADRADWELARHQEQLHVRAAAVDAARADVAEARARLDRAHQAHDEVRRRRDRLARVRTPEGLSVLADRVAELARQADDAERRLTEASDRHERAATALAADGDGSRLTEARGRSTSSTRSPRTSPRPPANWATPSRQPRGRTPRYPMHSSSSTPVRAPWRRRVRSLVPVGCVRCSGPATPARSASRPSPPSRRRCPTRRSTLPRPVRPARPANTVRRSPGTRKRWPRSPAGSAPSTPSPCGAP